ncbi:ribosomal-protein-alanine N-acetyltransferase [Lentilactobacillus sunkii]|uniref:Ribosomal-protein-alanine N-acetyltransferase n=1 Tax=Lentilactobacillus sunkii TaxID=481719 RepID=A0A1E7XE08_9LACO|nr:GNAT family N-acetyltransferase [Lentilactobacillus sunkii]OFA11222.1 ribosomal-protein-alanine N-acetyltransferase [Lentilactobacillus sunkii]
MQLPMKTDRITITKITADDLEAYEKLISIPQIAVGAGFNLISNKQMLGELAKRQIANPNTFGIRVHNRLVGAILLYEQIGQCGFPDEANLEISYFLDPELWNQGLMTEALEKLIEAFRKTSGVKTFNAEVFVDNASSKALLEKIGFQQVSTVIDPLVGSKKLIYKLEL